MSKNTKSLLRTVWGNLLNHLTAYIFGAGFGALILSYFREIAEIIGVLWNSPTSLGVSLILASLFATLIYRLSRPKKKNKIELIEEPLVEVGPYKWKISLYSNGKFSMRDIPYCSKHEMLLYENYPLFFCPRHRECKCQISKYDIESVRMRAKSIIESMIRDNMQYPNQT